MSFEVVMLGLVVIVMAGQFLITLQVRDRLEGMLEEMKKAKG